MLGETGVFLSGYCNPHGDSPYDEGYLDALCTLDRFNGWNDREAEALKRAKEALMEKIGE